MDISHLTRVLPIPDNTHDSASDEQWKWYEHTTGIHLPADYKTFLQTYGTGHIGMIIFPYNPFCTQKSFNYYHTTVDWMQQIIGITSAQFKFGRDVFPYDLYPLVGGIYPWGRTDTGDELYWATAGDPDTWTVLIYDRADTFEQHACNMTTFLAGFITGDIQSDILGSPDALDWDNLFAPVR